MTPANLQKYLNKLVKNQLHISTMIWGAPGIGKSSIVAQVAQENNLDFIDLRLSQLAPTDLRGLPVAVAGRSKKQGISTWYPPDFLPQDGKGILFLDELNMAPPTMQGVAQQLILDRKVGAYEVPEGWFIWAAGNRKEDRASIFEMPSPLANRFLHLEVTVDFDSFKAYALTNNFHEQIIAFLSYRSELLHKLDIQSHAWASPRTWEMASKLHSNQIDITPAVGEGASAEFNAFVALYQNLPDIDGILKGKGEKIDFPTEASTRYATAIALAIRGKNADEALNGFRWLIDKAGNEWIQLFAVDLMRIMRKKGQLGALSKLIKTEKQLQTFFKDFQNIIGIL
ncbi:ATP-binding protein [Cyanobacterium aponinum]|uniref:ATP-binding protein n=1 Tax=Cyanobacterium aponinum TaxID=379064 RepID=UPI000C12A9C2|nr:MoxR family ATPase [Cyanobacterium aponinum]PHV61555.1 ATPase [Cyanobacterium aponinum IPPAS B-1201]